MQCDAVVLGLGAMGAATLWRLAERGARAVGVDRFTPPHERGSSHGESRIIRSAYYEGPEYLPLVRSAFTLWRELEAYGDSTLLVMSGAAMIGAAQSDLLRGSLRTAREHGLEHALLTGAAAAARLPQHRIESDDTVLYEQAAGVLRPERCIAAMLQRATSLGATVRVDTAAERIEAIDGGVRVHISGAAPIEARRAVVSAGAWTASLLPDLPVPLRVERQVLAWFPVGHPAAFAPDAFPVFMRELRDGRMVYGLPSLDGATVKLAMHHEGETTDPDAVRRSVDDADLEPLRRFVRDRLRGVAPEPVRATTCLYTNTPDGHFLLDSLPGRPQAVVLSACSGHGFKFAPVMGDAAAALALDGATAHQVASFSLRRFAA
jgi:sarcosine oxidase